MTQFDQLNVKIFADGADKESMLRLYENPLIKGITTNPTLMRKAGISDYETYALDILKHVKSKPICFEVFSDDFDKMHEEALKIQKWQDNVIVKIPITNTRGESSVPLIKELSKQNVQLNITAMLTLDQVTSVADALDPETSAILSLFAGRIADTGIDPIEMVKEALKAISHRPKAELLWASVREILNIKHADDSGCHIVTVPNPILEKALKMWGMDLADLSLETVKMFYNDAVSAGYSILTEKSQSI